MAQGHRLRQLGQMVRPHAMPVALCLRGNNRYVHLLSAHPYSTLLISEVRLRDVRLTTILLLSYNLTTSLLQYILLLSDYYLTTI